MANIHIKCKNCGSPHLNVRTSYKAENTVTSHCFCTKCFAQQRVMSEIVSLSTPTYTERPEALLYDKPFREVNPDQLEIPTEQ
ncbi:hypothetical protein E4T80_12130 [Muribacter muris]|uniref:Zinc finger Ogr/Delta-type domain-containing protein n=1 Tax=Muribacter muris TaxID=67855 RepID=A0A4Y9JP37_9PAST|nr:hypothetical protein [Muribacter muris]MBF0786211.1 hypothetical protein [Muribacter muris]MBF0826456.1 hypothetical protein [Muribacter muris]TFV07573.1 hypothetical protein E4T80_12130 [Muribacter muris]